MTAGTRPKPVTMRLEAGTPITGTVKFVDFYPEKVNPNEPGKTMSAQWAFTGDLDGQRGKVYIDTYQLEQNPVAAGLVKQDGQWGDGNPKFKWTGGSGPVTFSKYLKDKKAHVRITAGGGAPTQVGDGAAGPARSTVATPPLAPTSIEAWWQEQEALMEHCLKLAQGIHAMTDADGVYQAMTSTAHSFYIQANREGKLAPPTAGFAPINSIPEALQDAPPDPEVPPWLQ